MTVPLTVVALGAAIRARRRALGLGLSEQVLADRSGLHRTCVGGVERGQRNLSFENLVALDVRLSDLIADAERRAERPR